MNQDIKLAGATLLLSATSTAYAQPASAASSASSVQPTGGTPQGGELWSTAIVGGFVGGVVAGVIVAVAVVSQLKKSLNDASSSKR